MSGNLRIGLGVLSAQTAPESGLSASDEYRGLVELAATAERAGFDSVWVSEHHGVDDGYLPSLTVALAAMAGVTERILLGMAVALAPFQHPIRFAEDCAVIDALSGGRLVVGLGIGWRKAEFETFGIPISERVGRTLDLVEFCRLAWSGHRFSFTGRHSSFDDVKVTPVPPTPIPILLGGTVVTAIERAAILGDGWIASPHNDLDIYLSQITAFDEAALAAGRRPDELSLGFHINAWVSKDGTIPDRVVRAIWYQIGKYVEMHQIDDGHPNGIFPALDMEHLLRRTILGGPADLVAALSPWVSAVDRSREHHIMVRLHHPGLEMKEVAEAIRLFGENVIPALKEHGRRDD